MPRTPDRPAGARPARDLLEAMLQTETAAVESIEDQLAKLDRARAESPEAGRAEETRILTKLGSLKRALTVAHGNRKALEEIITRITAPPLHLATYLETVDVDGKPGAVVSHEGHVRVVALGPDSPDGLEAGDDVLLGGELGVLVRKSPCGSSRCGQTAKFERSLPDGRLVLSWREDEVVVNAGAAVEAAELRRGDAVRWNPAALLAIEKVDSSTGRHFFLEKTPSVTFRDIGGLDEPIEKLQSAFRIRFEHPETAARYGVPVQGSALLNGPPGTGKTMLAKALANWLASLSPDGEARFISIKPGQLGSVWYSQTEANIREVFRVAREFGEENPRIPVVIFLDEIDSIGTPRGESFHRIDDRVQLALAGELDGLEERGNVFVIAATNRAEDLDAAFLRNGRFGDSPIEVPRPNRDAAIAILGKYLREDLPYEGSRDELIDVAVARLYSANGESDVARITFRDGTERVVRAADLGSGASLAKVARDAQSRACLRDARTGERGIRTEDVLEAIADELEAQASVLTPRSCRRFVRGLPQDTDPVRVERLQERETVRRHRYLELGRAAAREVAA